MNKRILGITIISSGIDPRKIWRTIIGIPLFLHDLLTFLKNQKQKNHDFKIKFLPIISDRFSQGGTAKGHYFHQDLWFAQQIYNNHPKEHLDVGSRIDGFIAHLLVFMNVTVIDIRPILSHIPKLNFFKLDIMDKNACNSITAESISCLHALEHFGLGRYGDPINIDGWKTGLINIIGMLQPNGLLYLSVPIGLQSIEFNAQRIFHPHTILNLCHEERLELMNYSYIDDNGDFHESANLNESKIKLSEFSKRKIDYGCGCFIFKKSSEMV